MNKKIYVILVITIFFKGTTVLANMNEITRPIKKIVVENQIENEDYISEDYNGYFRVGPKQLVLYQNGIKKEFYEDKSNSKEIVKYTSDNAEYAVFDVNQDFIIFEDNIFKNNKNFKKVYSVEDALKIVKRKIDYDYDVISVSNRKKINKKGEFYYLVTVKDRSGNQYYKVFSENGKVFKINKKGKR